MTTASAFQQQSVNELDSWVSQVRSDFLMVNCNPLQNDFSSEMSRLSLGDFFISTVTSSAIRYTRDQASIRRDPREETQLTLLLDGELRVRQKDRLSVLSAGEMVLYESTAPFELEWNNPYRAITVKIPTSLLAASVPMVTELTATKIAGSNGRGALIKSMLGTLSSLVETTSESDLVGIESPFLDLLSVTLNADVLGQSVGGQCNKKLVEIQNWLLKRLDDSDLDVVTIAQQNAVSVRTLNRLFAGQGTTVKKWLLQKRLEYSYRLLTVGGMHRVTDVALNAGFKDLSHFSRVFVQAFGLSPKALLQQKKG